MSFLESQMLWGFISLVLAPIAFSDNLIASWICLVLAWGVGVVGVYRVTLHRPHRLIYTAVGAVVIGAALHFVAGWFDVPKATTQTSAANQRPDVLLLAIDDQLRLHNRGISDLYLWGNKVDGSVSIESVARGIPVGAYYYFLTDRLKAFMLKELGNDGEKLIPFSIYLADAQGKRYTAEFFLLVKMQRGQMEIHTQQLGVKNEGWVGDVVLRASR